MSTGAILLAVEMSEDDRPLLEVAKLYAKALGARLYLVHAVPPEPDFVGLPKEGEAEPARRRGRRPRGRLRLRSRAGGGPRPGRACGASALGASCWKRLARPRLS